MRRPARRGVRLTLRGLMFLVAAAVAFVAAYALGFRQLLYVAVALGALPLFAYVVVRTRLPKLSITRSFSPHVVEAGSTATVSVLVRNLGAAPTIRASWRDVLPWEGAEGPQGELPVLQPGGARYSHRGNTTTVDYEVTPPRRGIFPIGPFTVHLGDAFGLVSTSYAVGDSQDLVVTPEVVPLAETGLSVSAGDGESRLVQRRSSGDDDDSMTREYRTGDAMRRVHWRASARHGDLMVRQEEQRSFPEARIIVDTRGVGYGDLSGDERTDSLDSDSFEWAVRMLASVAVHLRRFGFLVTVEETGARQLDLDAAARRTWHDEEFLADLAALRLTARFDSAMDMAESSEKGRGSNGPIVAIVGTPDAQTVEWMLRQRRPGDVAVAFMVRSTSKPDPLDRTFGQRTTGGDTVHMDRLANSGWLIVPVRPGDDHAAAWDAVVFETGRSRAGS